ncbi:MAG: FHA domain-containing protein [Candidatus Rifleibacteriota bacterium]
MNWLYFLEVSFSGILAGLITWLVTPEGNPWDLFDNFQKSLLANGLFYGLFVGLVSAIPVLINEKRLSKCFGIFISASAVGLAVIMMSTVVYTILGELAINHLILSVSTVKLFWWLFLSIALSSCFAILHHSMKIFCRALMGLTPGFLIAGSLVNKLFVAEQNWLMAYLFVGLIISCCFVLAWELLKEAWLDEESGSGFLFRYYLDSPEYFIGGSDDCNLSIDGMPAQLCVIFEKEGLHYLEVFDDKSILKINNCRFRYRVLIDGDIIKAGDRTFIYHSKFARSRDILPEAAA